MFIPHPAQVIYYSVVAKFASALQRDVAYSWREIFTLLLSSAKNALCLLVPPFVEHDGGQPDDENPANQPDVGGIAKKQIGITIFMSFISTLLASIISYTIFANTQGYPLVTEMSYR